MEKLNEILKSVRELAVIALAAVLAANLAAGCASAERRATVKSVVSAALKDAYALGGATAVSNRIEQLALDGKITEEQAAALHEIAQGVYERVLEHLDESAAATDAADYPTENADANCGNCDECRAVE